MKVFESSSQEETIDDETERVDDRMKADRGQEKSKIYSFPAVKAAMVAGQSFFQHSGGLQPKAERAFYS